MDKQSFDPNQLTFEEGLQRLKNLIQRTPGFPKGKIVTSRDPAVRKSIESLNVTNVPDGFKKHQLPIFFEGGPGAQFFISVGNPDVEVPKHSHTEGDGFRFIATGSIIYEDVELTAGDWMFIPKGAPYSFRVGPAGATFCYCYQCCCAPR